MGGQFLFQLQLLDISEWSIIRVVWHKNMNGSMQIEQAGVAIERSGDMIQCAFGDGAGGHYTDVGGGAKIVVGQVR